jgi:hypothetical protein
MAVGIDHLQRVFISPAVVLVAVLPETILEKKFYLSFPL